MLFTFYYKNNAYNKRNKSTDGKKDELHLNKHAMHLIRLFVTGTEILEGKGVNTYREKEREFFLDIRKGKYSYSAAENTSLPDGPDYKRVE